jgi:hypothetical protein
LAENQQELREPGALRLMRREDRIARTGSHCPTPGTWESTPDPTVRITLQSGDLMPPLNGTAVQWRFLPQPTAFHYQRRKG